MNLTSKQQQIIKTSLAYGFGLLLGNTLTVILFQLVPAERFFSGNPGASLVEGILLAFLITGLGGFAGGFMGGYTLPALGKGKGRWGYAWRSGITFGVGYSLLIFPLILITSLLSYYDIAETPIYMFGLIYGLIGAVFGVIMGLSLGVWTIGRRFPPITWLSALGFGLGGFALGLFVWVFIFAVTNGQVNEGPWWWLQIGMLLFGCLGGASLGFAYERLAKQPDEIVPMRGLTLSKWRRRWAIIGGVLFLIVLLIRPLLAAIGDLATPRDAALSPILDLPTTVAHWLAATAIADANQPAITTGANGRIALTYLQENQLRLQIGQWDAANQKTTWAAPIVVAQGDGLAEPQLAVAENGRIHLIWIQNNVFAYAQCSDNECTPAQSLPASASNACSAPPVRQPTLAVNEGDVLLVWENGREQLSYSVWPADVVPTSLAVSCVPTTEAARSPQLADNQFSLVYQADEVVYLTRFAGDWTPAEVIGNGRNPHVYVDAEDTPHTAWCAEDDGVAYLYQGSYETVSDLSCLSRPEVTVDAQQQVHVVWASDEVVDVNGMVQAKQVIYESIKTTDGWSTPAIVANSQTETQPNLTNLSDGSLHLTWANIAGANYAAQVQYTCDEAALSDYGRLLYDVARQEKYIPAEDLIPYCQNQYDRLLITPNPNPVYSDAPTPTNGVFDTMGDMIRGAEYEVLFSTMWYDTAINHDSPGAVIADAVADLYQLVKANPEQYPRGMTVRIMLDNPPEIVLGDVTGQLWTLLGDLRRAGIDKMVDEDIGWRLEVADFEGSLPHSHVKTIVIDGKTATANGFNMTYNHFPIDHPSGKGNGRFDVGLQITGPAAQATQRMFDDMWAGADQRTCLNLNPPLGIPWQVTCFDKTAVADHVPEVQKFYLPGGSSDAFSMYRSKVYDQADQQTITVLSAAQETIDTIHVNFTLDLICNLNILFEVCNIDIAPDYMGALLQAAQNGAYIRALIKPGPFEGIENQVALAALGKRIIELGIEDQVEIRYFDGDFHAKVALIDNQLLIVGSQNFHYSAFGTGSGLTEYSFAIEDEQAVTEFQAIFEYEWARGAPAN